MKKKRKGERLRSFHSPLKNLQHFSYLTSHFLVVKYRSAINYPPVSWEGREMHFPLDRSVACSADFDGAAELPVSKRESRLRWRLARRLSIASPHVSSAFVFPPARFPPISTWQIFEFRSETEDAEPRVERGGIRSLGRVRPHANESRG